MDEILPFDDLRELSGFKSLKRISQWLKEAGVPFLTDRYGRPRVNRYALRKAMGGSLPGEDAPTAHSQEPDWSGIQ